MTECAKQVTEISGIGKSRTGNILAAFVRAHGHLMTMGQNSCQGGTCESGRCTFGITELTNAEIRMEAGPTGEGVRVILTGNGECFCGS